MDYDSIKYSALFTNYKNTTVDLYAEEFSRMTCGTVFPQEVQGNESRISVARDYQSVGSMLVNNLASKLVSVLFPVGRSFFKLADTPLMQSIGSQLGISEGKLDAKFSEIEQASSEKLFTHAGYAALTYLMKVVAITGNALLYRDTEGRFIVYNLRDFAIKRDYAGKPQCIVLREKIAQKDCPPGTVPVNPMNPFEEYDLYTRILKVTRNGRVMYEVSQQLRDNPVGEPSYYPEMLCPYIPVVWNLVRGEDYGRGLVEEYAGDFAKLSELSQASLMYEVEMMRVVHLVQAGVDIDSLEAANVGQYVAGANGAVEALEAGDAKKLQAVMADIQEITIRLSKAFMYSGNTRDGERVTAEEIRQNVKEVEQSLGGVYALLSEHLHIPLAYILSVEVFPPLSIVLHNEDVKLDIQVGVAALNRSLTVQKLAEATLYIGQILPVFAQATQRTNPDALIDVILRGYDIDSTEFFYTPEQLKQKQEAQQAAAQQQQQQLQQQAAQQPQYTQQLANQLGLNQ